MQQTLPKASSTGSERPWVFSLFPGTPSFASKFKGFSGPNVHSGLLGTQGSQLRSCHLDVEGPSPRARPHWDLTVLTGSLQAASCLRLKHSCRACGATSHGAPGFPEAQRSGTKPAPHRFHVLLTSPQMPTVSRMSFLQ